MLTAVDHAVDARFSVEHLARQRRALDVVEVTTALVQRAAHRAAEVSAHSSCRSHLHVRTSRCPLIPAAGPTSRSGLALTEVTAHSYSRSHLHVRTRLDAQELVIAILGALGRELAT